MHRIAELTTQDTKVATVYKRLLMGKATERTRDAYGNGLRDFAQFLEIESVGSAHPLTSVPDTIWSELDTAHLAPYLEYLKNTVSDKTGREYSTATIARRMTAVRKLLTEATYLGYFPREQLEYIKERLSVPEVSNEHHSGITPDEQDRLLEAADSQPGLKGKRECALFRLWLDTGIRRAELAALKVRDLVVKEGVPTLIIRHGKGNKVREIGLESYTAYVVKDWLNDSGQDVDPERPVFCQVRKFGRVSAATYKTVDPDKHLSGEALRVLVKWTVKGQESRARLRPTASG